MSLRLYLDDCAYDKALVRLLHQVGWEVVSPFVADILRAIQNLIAADMPITGQFIPLNVWRYVGKKA